MKVFRVSLKQTGKSGWITVPVKTDDREAAIKAAKAHVIASGDMRNPVVAQVVEQVEQVAA